jgi:hypothetical protein
MLNNDDLIYYVCVGGYKISNIVSYISSIGIQWIETCVNEWIFYNLDYWLLLNWTYQMIMESNTSVTNWNLSLVAIIKIDPQMTIASGRWEHSILNMVRSLLTWK